MYCAHLCDEVQLLHIVLAREQRLAAQQLSHDARHRPRRTQAEVSSHFNCFVVQARQMPAIQVLCQTMLQCRHDDASHSCAVVCITVASSTLAA
jgi:hypothetical protein